MTNNLDKNTKHSMLTRVITGLVIISIGVPCAILGEWYYFILISLLAIFGTFEFIHAPHKENNYNVFIYLLMFIATISFIYWGFVKNDEIRNGILQDGVFVMKTIGVSTMGITITFLFLLFISILDSSMKIKDVMYLFGMSIFYSIGVQSILFMRFFPNNHEEVTSCLLLFYVIIGTFGSDIGAYFIGVLFGKHKMNPRISPKKTWEGFVGGVVFSFVCSLSFVFILDSFGYKTLPILDIEHWYWVLLISFVMPFLANLGDFTFSAIKRNYDIKDFGNVFPGHGGVLDRIDSLLVTSVIVGIMVILITNGWNFMI